MIYLNQKSTSKAKYRLNYFRKFVHINLYPYLEKCISLHVLFENDNAITRSGYKTFKPVKTVFATLLVGPHWFKYFRQQNSIPLCYFSAFGPNLVGSYQIESNETCLKLRSFKESLLQNEVNILQL